MAAVRKKLRLKILLIGDSTYSFFLIKEKVSLDSIFRIGKTSLMNKFCLDKFSMQYKATIGRFCHLKFCFPY